MQTPPETVAHILADYANGLSLPAVSRKHNVAEGTAHKYIKQAGISRTLSEAKALQYARDEEDVELTGGRWVRVGAIMRWQPGPTAVPDLIACPCGAGLSEPCRTTGGNATRHADRIIPRRCQCGNSLPTGLHYCTEECRREARAATYRRRELRTPTRERRAA